MDVLSDLLRVVRLSGAVMFRGDLSSPWALVTPEPAQLARMLSLDAARLVLFHVVAEGHCWIALAGGQRIHLECGDLVVLPYGERHAMGSDGTLEPLPIGALLAAAERAEGLSVVSHGGGGGRTSLICGYLTCDEMMFNPLLKVLPPLLHVRTAAEPECSDLAATVRRLISSAQSTQAGAGCLRARLAELLFLEVLLRHIA